MEHPDFDSMNLSIRDSLIDQNSQKTLWLTGYFVADFEKNISFVSKPLTDLGFKEADLMNGEYQRRIHQEDISTYKSLWNRVFKGWEDELYCEYRLTDSEGRWHWILTHAIVTNRKEDGTVSKLIGIDRNISSQKYAEAYIYDELIKSRNVKPLADSIQKKDSDIFYNEALNNLKHIVQFDYCEIHQFRKGSFEENYHFPGDLDNLNLDLSFVYYDLKKNRYPVIFDNLQNIGPFSSLMAIPLRISAQYVGSVYLLNKKKGFYKGIDLYPVHVFADALAVSIRNNLK